MNTSSPTARSPWQLLFGADAAVLVVSTLLKWWDDSPALSLQTQWPKAILASGVVMLVAALVSSRKEREWPRTVALMATVAAVMSTVAFYIRVDDTLHFAELPFTRYVEIGFFVALLGLGWAVVSGVGLLLGDRGAGWAAPAVMSLVVAGLVMALYAATTASRDRISDPAPEQGPIPEATVGPRPTR